MTEQCWVLHFAYGTDRDYQHGYAQKNPATGEWTSVHAGFPQYATTFPSERTALSALVPARARLAGSPWLIPVDAWTLRRVGDVGEPLTRFHADVNPLGEPVTA